MNNHAIQEITSEQFLDRIVVPQADALVKISTAWSGAGQMLCHTLQDLSREYSGRLNFFYVDNDANAQIGAQYMVETVPTLLFFKKGTLVDKLSGLTHRHAIESKINQIVNA
jgi:thioredoxin 1